MVFAVLVALASAASFAAGSALQHRVAGSASAHDESSAGLIRRVAQRPSWLGGLALSALAFALHALALSRGDLALVQPVIVSGIVFAVLFRAAFDRHWPSKRVLVWLVLTWAGLALFLLVRPPGADRAPRTGWAVGFVVVGVLLAAAAVLLSTRTKRERRRGLLLGGSAGVLFGLVAGLVKLVIAAGRDGFGHIFTDWSLWTLLVVGAAAVVLNQRAYQATRLSVTSPVLNIGEVLVAIAFGALVLGEDPGSSAGVLVGEVVGLAMVVLGIRQLSAQPPSEQEQRNEQPQQADASRD